MYALLTQQIISNVAQSESTHTIMATRSLLELVHQYTNAITSRFLLELDSEANTAEETLLEFYARLRTLQPRRMTWTVPL